MKMTIHNLSGQIFSIAIILAGALGGPVSHAACTPPPAGIVSWLPGEGKANDIIGTNNGGVNGSLSYTNGLVGEAFVFDDSTSYILVPASPSLDIGSTGRGVTIEAWILPDAFDVNVSGAP